MKPTDQNPTESHSEQQALSLDVRHHAGGVSIELQFADAVLRDGITLLSKFLLIAKSAADAAAEHKRREDRRVLEAQDARSRSIHRRRVMVAAARVFRFKRREQPCPDTLAEFLEEQAAIYGISRPALVGITTIHERQVRRRLNAIRRAVAFRMAQSGSTGAEIADRLGVGVRAANKLVRAELERRNQIVREAA